MVEVNSFIQLMSEAPPDSIDMSHSYSKKTLQATEFPFKISIYENLNDKIAGK